ncbi:hypothetical protein CQW23_09526 [Capsicum baccatum]|uniref:DUF3444 domain-containing protein n=1 Tax=Capsicum baccatum TaxID=33114 RepID=A0A2G2WX80_CAPBA|nr:hypothetical protein CQW23_09526 [Capsicum baccatum]
MATEDKTLFCFCHWGRKIFDQLCFDPSDKILHFTVKFDRSQLIQLSDQEDVNSLLQFNDGYAHVYASGLEKEPYSILSSVGAEKVELTVDSDSEADTIAGSVLPEVYDYHDAEFSDFDNNRAQDCFARDQIWACFDTVDGMPRFYMHIRKVVDSPEFKVLFSWLEAHPEDQKQKAWVRAELPVGCGKFRCGSKQFTFDRLIFSHQVQCEVDKTGVHIIYPRKGETWAVFKDWDISWSLIQIIIGSTKYEIVEILSDYVVDVGVQRVFGAGSFELHPICLPYNSNDIWYPGKVKEDCRTANSEPVENVLPVAASLKSGDLNVIQNAINGESVKVQVSANEMNISEKKRPQMSSCYANDGDFVHSCVKKTRQSIPDIPINLSCEADAELHSRTKSFDLSDTFEEFFCDFKVDRCREMFEVNQVWAVYARNSTLPKTYALVKKIVSVPFKLHVVLLEVCAGPDNAAPSVCGTFEVENEKFEIYPRGGEIWAMYKCLKKSGFDTDKFEYEIVEVIENSKDNRIQVSSMVRVNGFKSVFIRSQTSNSVILEDEFWRFSHQIPAFLLTGEKAGVLRGFGSLILPQYRVLCKVMH